MVLLAYLCREEQMYQPQGKKVQEVREKSHPDKSEGTAGKHEGISLA